MPAVACRVLCEGSGGLLVDCWHLHGLQKLSVVWLGVCAGLQDAAAAVQRAGRARHPCGVLNRTFLVRWRRTCIMRQENKSQTVVHPRVMGCRPQPATQACVGLAVFLHVAGLLAGFPDGRAGPGTARAAAARWCHGPAVYNTSASQSALRRALFLGLPFEGRSPARSAGERACTCICGSCWLLAQQCS
jgi:hypothetical protein